MRTWGSKIVVTSAFTPPKNTDFFVLFVLAGVVLDIREGQRSQNRPFFFLGKQKAQRKIGAQIDRFSGEEGGFRSESRLHRPLYWLGRRSFPRTSAGNHISRVQEVILSEASAIDARVALVEAACVAITLCRGRAVAVRVPEVVPPVPGGQGKLRSQRSLGRSWIWWI